LKLAVARQLSAGVKLAQTGAELAAKNFRQGPDGEAPVRRRSLPARSVEPQAAAGDNTVQGVSASR
jgi:hypothetical protein